MQTNQNKTVKKHKKHIHTYIKPHHHQKINIIGNHNVQAKDRWDWKKNLQNTMNFVFCWLPTTGQVARP